MGLDSTYWAYAEAITPSDSDELAGDCVGLHVKTTSGLVTFRSAQTAKDGTDVDGEVYMELGQYLLIPGGVRQVRTATTAVGVVGLYRRLAS